MTTGVDLAFPFTGRWLVQNSPANRPPSHGTTLFATSYAIDFVPLACTVHDPISPTSRACRQVSRFRTADPLACRGYGRCHAR